MASRKPVREPTLTKTQQLRQAKSAAFVREYQAREQKAQADARSTRRSVPVRGPSTERRKIDMAHPAPTKAMLARIKQAEKIKEEHERKQQEKLPRKPRRTLPPLSGTARLGREKPSRRSAEPRIPERTRELARSIGADIVQAEPIGNGPVENIVIPAGAISEDRPTIVTVPIASAFQADRSVNTISERLDEQDAIEIEAIQSKLEELQQARRDFVMATTNVGCNAVNVADDLTDTRISFRSTPPGSPITLQSFSPPRYIQRIPSIEDEMFKIQYGLDHPDVVAARRYAQKQARAYKRREDDEMSAVPRYNLLDTSLDEIQGECPACARRQSHRLSNVDIDELERFFDVERYPLPPRFCPPPGREYLPPDLWHVEDVWYRPPSPDRDLIEFDLMDFTP